MSVVIKGLEMPKNCEECEFCQHALNAEWCYITELAIPENCITGETRQTDCPLVPVPPHGRLIDADALKEASKDTVFVSPWWLLDSAPTILEAEGGKNGNR